MESINVMQQLFTVAPVVGVLGWWISNLLKQIKELRTENREHINNYKTMAENAIKIITLADDKLSKDEGNNEKIINIHRMVEESLNIIKNWKQIL